MTLERELPALRGHAAHTAAARARHGTCTVTPEKGCPATRRAPRAPQVFAQVKYFIPDPIANDVAYQARAQPFLVFGLLTTGLAIGHHNAATLGM